MQQRESEVFFHQIFFCKDLSIIYSIKVYEKLHCLIGVQGECV